MKKAFLSLAALALVAVGAVSCQSKCDKAAGVMNNSDDDVAYTGLIPAADALGVRYTLLLDYDDNNTKGDYDLIETYVMADTLSASGLKDADSFKSEGDFTVGKTQDGKSYLKLVQDLKDSSAGSAAGPLYFLVDSDSTLTLVGEDLQPSVTPGMNYTLNKVK